MQAERIPYPHNVEHHGKADGTDCGQEACSGLRKKKRTSPRPRRIQSRKNHLGKHSQIRIRCLRRIPEDGRNSGRGGRSGRCVQQSAIQTADGTPCAIWRQLDAHKMARSSTPGKKVCHAAWKLDLHAPTTDNGLPQGSPLSPVLYNVYTKGLADLNSNGLSRVRTPADDGLFYKTASDISTAVTAVQEQLEKVSHWCQETESEINPNKAQALWCTLNNKAVGQAMPAVSFNGEVVKGGVGGGGVGNGYWDLKGERGLSGLAPSLMKSQVSCLSLPWTSRCLWLSMAVDLKPLYDLGGE